MSGNVWSGVVICTSKNTNKVVSLSIGMAFEGTHLFFPPKLRGKFRGTAKGVGVSLLITTLRNYSDEKLWRFSVMERNPIK